MKQPEWQRGGICGALSSTSQQLNIEPSEQRERDDIVLLSLSATGLSLLLHVCGKY